MSGNMQQNPDGSWTPAEPVPVQGRVARFEFWLRRHGWLPRLAAALGRWDERNLGK